MILMCIILLDVHLATRSNRFDLHFLATPLSPAKGNPLWETDTGVINCLFALLYVTYCLLLLYYLCIFVCLFCTSKWLLVWQEVG